MGRIQDASKQLVRRSVVRNANIIVSNEPCQRRFIAYVLYLVIIHWMCGFVKLYCVGEEACHYYGYPFETPWRIVSLDINSRGLDQSADPQVQLIIHLPIPCVRQRELVLCRPLLHATLSVSTTRLCKLSTLHIFASHH